MELYFQGRVFLNKGTTPAFMAQARDFFAHAPALDPAHVEAAVGAAQVDMSMGSAFRNALHRTAFPLKRVVMYEPLPPSLSIIFS